MNATCATNSGTREPPTDISDRRNYVCVRCGRAWRKSSQKLDCPYCGYRLPPTPGGVKLVVFSLISEAADYPDEDGGM